MSSQAGTKTFLMSPLIGALAAFLGWVGAVLFKNSMTEAEFAELSYGWEGAMIGGIAVGLGVMLVLASDLVEPIVMTLVAAIGGFLLAEYQEFPVALQRFESARAGYWFTVTMMIGILVLLLLGLKAARESNNRAGR